MRYIQGMSRLRQAERALFCTAVSFACTLFCAGQASSPAVDSTRTQLPADRRAYKAATAIADPTQRLTALRDFTADFRDSKYFDRAQAEALRLLLQYFLLRTAEIVDQVHVNVQNAEKGLDRWRTESSVADQLAGAGSAGVALPLAQKLAEDAYRNLTEDNFGKAMAKTFGQLEVPLPPPAEVLADFKSTRASTIDALAHVMLQQGKVQRASALLDESAAMQPLDAELHALRGEIAFGAHHEGEALSELEDASLLGELTPHQRETMLTLYRLAHGNSEAGLPTELDTRYVTLYPPTFQPASHASTNGGHTVLLELFTGSGCDPCVGADLAFDALLGSYSRQQVIALAFDQHVPRPDPLANPVSVARADWYNVTSTPNFVLDGRPLSIYGGPREGGESVYHSLGKLLDVQMARPSGVQLQLAATLRDGVVNASATVHTDTEPLLQATSAKEDAPWPGDKLAQANRSRAEAHQSPHLTVFVALVEDDVRYSGENGIRFHRMVVRDATAGDPVTLGSAQTITAAFDPAEISLTLESYLSGYEKANDRYGEIHFLTKGTAMQPRSLALAAWVQDSSTHRVLQAVMVPVADASPLAQQKNSTIQVRR